MAKKKDDEVKEPVSEPKPEATETAKEPTIAELERQIAEAQAALNDARARIHASVKAGDRVKLSDGREAEVLRLTKPGFCDVRAGYENGQLAGKGSIVNLVPIESLTPLKS